MNKLRLLSLLTALACTTLHAENPDYRFGKVSVDELNMTVYDKDPDADAVILYEDSKLYYQIGSGLDRTVDYRIRIKILKAEGTRHADVGISFLDYGNLRENIVGLEAAAYNLVDGKIEKTPLKRQYIFTEQVDEHRKLLKFSIPEVREGTVIEYKFRQSSKILTSIPSFRFQHDIPVARSHMQASIPEFFKFNLNLKGYCQINVREGLSSGAIIERGEQFSFNIRNIVASATDIPALKREPFVWSLDDYRSMLEFELAQLALPFSMVENFTTSWEGVNETLKESSFESHTRMNNPFREEVAAIKARQLAPAETAREILRLVQSKIKWNERYRLLSEGPRAAVNKGTGSSADINYVLMAALKDAGFSVVPILLSPRQKGRLPYTHPTLDGINAFVLHVSLGDGKFAYMDGTDPNSDLDLLPSELLVDRARIYNVNGRDGWCDLTNMAKNATVVNLILKLDPDGMLTGQVVEQLLNQPALEASTEYTASTSEEEYRQKIEKNCGFQVEDLSISGVSTKKVVRKYRISGTPDSTGEFVYINATVAPFMATNELNAQTRTLPIEFPYPQSVNIRCALELPEGYVVEEIPKNINLSVFEKGADCRYICTVSGKFIQINLQYTLNRIIYLPTEFHDLNTFFGMVADLSNSQFVIRKTAPEK